MKYKNKMKRFTLVELLVSLGVFSLLLVVFMQFFSGIRLSWTNSEKRSQVYANARVAMDMLSQLVSSYYYSSGNAYDNNDIGKYLFRAHQPSNAALSHKLYFASNTVVELPGSNPIRFIGLQVPTPDDSASYPASPCGDKGLYYKLIMTVISNEDAYWGAFFPPFMSVNVNTGELGNNVCSAGVAVGNLYSIMNQKLKLLSTNDIAARVELLDHVTHFKVRIFGADGLEVKPSAGTENIDNIVPSMIEISLSVLSGEDFTVWSEMKGNGSESAEAKKFREKNEFVFNRRIYIGDR